MREKRMGLALTSATELTTALTWFEWAEVLSYVVTIVGLPMAILVFLYEQRKERRNEEEEIYQRLSDEYAGFLKLVLDHADLQLLRKQGIDLELNEEQKERKYTLFNILISLFERAYLLVYEEGMDAQLQRLWRSWEDYMRDWCKRKDFRSVLPDLLKGEDEDFARLIQRIAEEEATKQTPGAWRSDQAHSVPVPVNAASVATTASSASRADGSSASGR
jgi:hypothetical protein